MPGLHERNLNVAPDAVDDLVLLREHDINEGGIVKDLRNRYNQDLIYSYIGPVLLSVNPFKMIPKLYTEQLMQEYYGRFKFEVAPHVFASAEDAHRKLMSSGINQCVLIAGESGAGKTEAAKKVMEYVSKVSSDSSDYAVDDQHHQKRYSKLTRTVVEIKDSLLKSNPVLEAFGNAKTIRNDNSSRFGKYMEIQMDYNGTPLGGKITNYLLEKPRVVHQAPGERNFHIFYQLTDGMNQRNPLYRDLQLNSSSNFDYLCDKAATKVNTVNDSEWFEEVDEAMAKVGIDAQSKAEFFRIVAAVLWLGNVKFKQARTKAGGQDKCEVGTPQELQVAAHLLSVQPKDLEEALTTRSRETTIDKVRSPLVKVDECNKVRDALAKALYARMFQKLVAMINETIHTPVAELSLGVLDIYGFEIFEQNSFEQLCINFCNEKLQQYFIQLTLKAEQEEYIREGITWKDIDYFNNKVVCDLIEGKKPPGIIAYLDEQIMLNRDEDLSFLNKMNKQIRSPHYQIPPSNSSTATEFVIRHYAGDVKYSAEGMIDKNKDTLFRDLLVLAGQKSGSAFLASMFPEGKEKHNFKKPVTAGTQFVSDMNQLIANLEKCEPHYIRCIKPNDNKRSNFFDDERVLHQVKYLGLLENIKVRRAGYAFRREYELFVRRYKMLSPQTWPNPSSYDHRANTALILQETGIQRNQYAEGKTKVFIEQPESLFKIEKLREQAMHGIVSLIQRAFRRWRMRLFFQKIRELAVNLLHGKKRRNNSWVLYFLGDYINAQAVPQITDAVRQNNDGRIVFADEIKIHVLGKKPHEVRQPMVMTARSFMFFKKGKQSNYDNIHRIGFDQVESLTFSTFADNFFVLKLKPQPNPKNGKMQPQASYLMESVRKSEIATVFSEEYKQSFNSANPPLFFQDATSLVVVEKKGGIGGMFAKAKPVEQPLQWLEDPSLGHRNARLIPMVTNKKAANYNPEGNRIAVSAMLGSRAELQLHTPLPERVIAHTAVGRQGKKRARNRRRKY